MTSDSKMERAVTIYRPGGIAVATVLADSAGVSVKIGHDLVLAPVEAEELAREIKRAALFLYEQGMT